MEVIGGKTPELLVVQMLRESKSRALLPGRVEACADIEVYVTPIGSTTPKLIGHATDALTMFHIGKARKLKFKLLLKEGFKPLQSYPIVEPDWVKENESMVRQKGDEQGHYRMSPHPGCWQTRTQSGITREDMVTGKADAIPNMVIAYNDDHLPIRGYVICFDFYPSPVKPAINQNWAITNYWRELK